MNEKNKYNKADVLIVGAGPAGLACAIHLKKKNPRLDICLIEKAADLGNHNLSGAVLEPEPLHTLLDEACPQWKNTDQAKEILAQKVQKDNIMFCLGKKISFNISFVIKLAKILHLGFGQMLHKDDYIVSVSELTKWLGSIARNLDIELLTGFAAEDVFLDNQNGSVVSVKLVDQGLDKKGEKQPNYIPGEKIHADFIVLAEGCDGLVTESFIEKAKLQRKSPQLYSVGVKELIKVSQSQYEKFTSSRVVHAMGYPLWRPLIGPAMFGGGIIYPARKNHIAVGIIVGADWIYKDFNPQDALTLFKNHSFVGKFIRNGSVVEAGAKMIPEAGLYAVPNDPKTGTIGKANCIITGDSAGFVNMLKIKGLHNAIYSGIYAADAIAENINSPQFTALRYTELIKKSKLYEEMLSAANFRQTVAKFGPLIGLPLSAIADLLPRFKVEQDTKSMTAAEYKLKPNQQFDKDTFAAMADTQHREEQPSHLKILDTEICKQKCTPIYDSPCITFCPAEVYEIIRNEVKPANPSNCLHCKTCQIKCPLDNIRWTAPEGAGGPRYKRM